MYKSRIYVWIVILLCYLTFISLKNISVSDMIIDKNSRATTWYIDANASVKNALIGADTGRLEFKVSTKDEASVIIQEHSDETINGFKKYEKAIFSPVIYLVNRDFDVPDSLYFEYADANCVNFSKITDAVINGTTLKDLGVDSDKKKTVQLYIPKKGSEYHDLVVEQMYIALNNNRKPNDDERAKLDVTINKLLEKCNFYEGMESTIKNVSRDDYCVFLGMEKDMNNYSLYGSDPGDYNLYYFEKMLVTQYDIFVKENIVILNKPLTEMIEKHMLKRKQFVDDTNFRTTADIDFDFELNGDVMNYIDIIE